MLANYDGAPFRGIPYLQGDQEDEYIRFYNNTGGTLTNGDLKTVSTLVDITDSSNPILSPILVAVSTMAAESVLLAVVDDPAGTVANGAWGQAKIRGCVKANTLGTTDIAYGDQLQVVDATPTAFVKVVAATAGVGVILGGATGAIAMETWTTDTTPALKWVCLLGKRVSVAATE
jgi:hypothetical protein